MPMVAEMFEVSTVFKLNLNICICYFIFLKFNAVLPSLFHVITCMQLLDLLVEMCL